MKIKFVKEIFTQYKSRNLKFRVHTFLRAILCPFDRIESCIPKDIDSILDLGCGYGIWLNYLGLQRKNCNFTGVDIDGNKINIAKTTVNKHIKFIGSSILNLKTDNTDCITILDVMYLIPFQQQEQLLKFCNKTLNPGGYIIIKETEKNNSWKYYISLIQEFISVKLLRITYGQGFFWQNKQQFIEMLKRTNFKDITAEKIDNGYMHPHIIYIARKL